MSLRIWFVLLLILLGAGWGITQPLAKIAVSGGYRNFGIIFWQMLIGVIVLGAFLFWRGRWSNFGRRQFMFAIFIALIGTILPNGASYQAAIHLPAGVLSIAIAAVPMLAFPIALALRLDAFSWLRTLGLLMGMAGVAALVAPGSLDGIISPFWVLVALVGPMFYAIEGNTVAKVGMFGMDAVEVLFWASLVGTFIALPLCIANGTWINPIRPWGGPEYAILAGSVIHAIVYTTYVWMVTRTGPVFAGQVSYLVTGFGVFWAILLLSESYSAGIWLSLILMACGLFLVQPRLAEAE